MPLGTDGKPARARSGLRGLRAAPLGLGWPPGVYSLAMRAIIVAAAVALLLLAGCEEMTETPEPTPATTTPDPDLSGQDLSGQDLSGQDLSGQDLSDANLAGANLSNVTLSRANLAGANLSYANLTGATLSSANLTRANLTGANLRRANFTGASLSAAIFTDAVNCDEAISLPQWAKDQCGAGGPLNPPTWIHGTWAPCRPIPDSTEILGITFSATTVVIRHHDGMLDDLSIPPDVVSDSQGTDWYQITRGPWNGRFTQDGQRLFSTITFQGTTGTGHLCRAP